MEVGTWNLSLREVEVEVGASFLARPASLIYALTIGDLDARSERRALSARRFARGIDAPPDGHSGRLHGGPWLVCETETKRRVVLSRAVAWVLGELSRLRFILDDPDRGSLCY